MLEIVLGFIKIVQLIVFIVIIFEISIYMKAKYDNRNEIITHYRYFSFIKFLLNWLKY